MTLEKRGVHGHMLGDVDLEALVHVGKKIMYKVQLQKDYRSGIYSLL